ncbi:hypothetical protein PTKU64_80380 [Paraburkholderia terrae]|uniref:DUF4280 domain-containing protein n=1 Tax=Paraburkholderia terrae TaxID=311230 RepID=A0ABN6JWG7_9BURK|nr:DUF4280 domain-containing protein [Paraburkholderia terrae]BCZ84363.1 hypothetical protein PTKU64_80380 [Paraburkholderia terrae]
MAGPLFHVGAMAMCPHGGQIAVLPGSPRVLVSGMPVATVADQHLVAGCAFTIPPPQPCLQVMWLTPATRVLVNGSPPITQASTGLAISATGVPQGPPMIVSTQTRVSAL